VLKVETVYVLGFCFLALVILPSNSLTNEALAQTPREQKALGFIGNWAIETGADKKLGRSLAAALGFNDEMSGRQIAFTSMAGEGHIALVCELDKRRLIFLAHLDTRRLGIIWRTSEDGILEATAVRRSDGVHAAENLTYAKDFEAEKAFFAAMLSDARVKDGDRKAPSCGDNRGASAGTI
jgi:hypothetical protein